MKTPLERRVDAILALTQHLRECLAVGYHGRSSTLRDVRAQLSKLSRNWERPCFICQRIDPCEHREPELVRHWSLGNLE